MTLKVDSKKLDKLAEMLQGMFDEVYWSKRSEESLSTIRRFVWGDGQYTGARKILELLGVQVRYDKNTTRPVSILEYQRKEKGNEA